MNGFAAAPRLSWNRAFCTALFVLVVTGISVVFGFHLTRMFYGDSFFQFHIQRTDPYADCDFFTEYAMCASRFCRPLLLQALILWLAPYTVFDLPLTSAVFLARGISLGSALYVCRIAKADIFVFALPLLYAMISAALVLCTYSLRGQNSPRPLRETCVHFLVAAGFTFMIQILSPLIL